MHRLIVARATETSRAEDTAADVPTPVLEIEERMLLMPLVGTTDSRRAANVADQLVRAVLRSRARVVVLDVTGVPGMDPEVVDHLLGAANSARLIGALVILTGVSNAVASTIVSLRVNVDELTCATDLRSGIELGRHFLSGRSAFAGGPFERDGATARAA